MKNLYKKIMSMALAGMMVSGVFLSPNLSFAKELPNPYDLEVLLENISPQRAEDLKSIYHLSERGEFVVSIIDADPDAISLEKIKSKGIKIIEKSLDCELFIKKLRQEVRDGSGLKEIGLKKGEYYLLKFHDKDVEDLELLIHVMR